MAHATLTETEARQGETRKGWVRRILVVGTVLAVVGLVAAFIIQTA